jgi:hypothetical protein
MYVIALLGIVVMEFRLRFVLHTVFPLFPHMGRNDGALAGFGVNEPSLFCLLELLFHGQFVITSFIFDRLDRRFDACLGLAPCLSVVVDIELRSNREEINNLKGTCATKDDCECLCCCFHVLPCM